MAQTRSARLGTGQEDPRLRDNWRGAFPDVITRLVPTGLKQEQMTSMISVLAWPGRSNEKVP